MEGSNLDQIRAVHSAKTPSPDFGQLLSSKIPSERTKSFSKVLLREEENDP